MNYILSLANEDKILVGWYETSKDYNPFSLHENGEIEWGVKIKKSLESSRASVLNVINKFNPYTIFFKTPIEAEYLNYDELIDKAI